MRVCQAARPPGSFLISPSRPGPPMAILRPMETYQPPGLPTVPPWAFRHRASAGALRSTSSVEAVAPTAPRCSLAQSRNKIQAERIPEDTEDYPAGPPPSHPVSVPESDPGPQGRLFAKILHEALAASRYRRSTYYDTFKSRDLTNALHYEKFLPHLGAHVLVTEADHRLTSGELRDLMYRLRHLTPSCLKQARRHLLDLCALD